MSRQISNPYWYILAVPLLAFLGLVAAQVPADTISVPGRIFIFMILGYVTARYAGSSPRLMLEGNFSPEARNVTGFGLFLIAQMMSQAYAVVYVSLERPDYLSSQYWVPAFVTLGAVGLALVASSIPKFPLPPFGLPRGLSAWASVFVAIASGTGLYIASHAPLVAKIVSGLWGALLHAF